MATRKVKKPEPGEGAVRAIVSQNATVNVRKTVDSNSTILDTLCSGTIVMIEPTSKSRDHAKVFCPGGAVGYAKIKYFKGV